jgi:hypothetical protein
MYNYLSTSFDKNSIVTFSNQKSVSERTKMLHNYTNLIGSGALKYVFGANLITILGILVIIAFTYSVGMAANNIKRFVTMVTQLPFAALGVVKSIAQVCVLTFAMIFEILGTSFMYMFVSQLFTVFATAVEETASDVTGFNTITPSFFAAIGLNNSVFDSRFGLAFGVVAEIAIMLFIIRELFHYRRAFFFGYEKVWCRIDAFMLFEECAYVKDMLPMDAPYFWDRVNNGLSGVKNGIVSVGQILRPSAHGEVALNA